MCIPALFPYHINKTTSHSNPKIVDLLNQQKYLFRSFNYKNIYKNVKNPNNINDYPPPPEDDNYTDLKEKIDELNTKIGKSNIYIIFLSILAFILFLLLVIYSSIKCYILCSKKVVQDYRVSDLSMNKLGGVYNDVNQEDKFKSNISNNSNDYDAPIYANNKKNNSNANTFNPDKFIASNEDKNIYKPFKNEDI